MARDVHEMEKLIAEQIEEDRSYLTSRVFRMGMLRSRFDMVKWALIDSPWKFHMDDSTGLSSVSELCGETTDVRILELIMNTGYKLTNSAFDCAVAFGVIAVARWLCEHGIYPSTIDIWDVDDEYVQLFHDYKIDGPHEIKCEAGTCSVCIAMKQKETIQELWEMDVDEYDNVIQWLPREMLEEVIVCI